MLQQPMGTLQAPGEAAEWPAGELIKQASAMQNFRANRCLRFNTLA